MMVFHDSRVKLRMHEKRSLVIKSTFCAAFLQVWLAALLQYGFHYTDYVTMNNMII